MPYRRYTTPNRKLCSAVLGLIGLLGCVGAACSSAHAQGAPPRPPAKPRAVHKRPVAPRSLLFFPADGQGTGVGPLTDLVTDVVKSRLAASDLYEVGVYRSSLASIRRAIKEGSVSVKGANAPFDSVSKVQNLMKLAGYDLAVDASIDYSYDAVHHQAAVSVTLSIIDLANGKIVVRPFAESFTTAENAVKSPDDLDAVKPSTRDLTEKLTTRLLEPSPTDAK